MYTKDGLIASDCPVCEAAAQTEYLATDISQGSIELSGSFYCQKCGCEFQEILDLDIRQERKQIDLDPRETV